MATPMQVVIDAADPHAQVRFWAQALHYEVEDHVPIVAQLLSAGLVQDEETIEVDGHRVFRDLAACSDPAGVGPRVLIQRVPEPKSVKNRVHLDLHVGPDQAPAEVERLIALGAAIAWVTEDRGPTTTTMRDPEGNEFCVS